MKKRSGFTLIEMVVVAMIIALLAVVIVQVSFVNPRAKARDLQRISDLNKIATALELYYADYQTYPSICDLDNQICYDQFSYPLSKNNYLGMRYYLSNSKKYLDKFGTCIQDPMTKLPCSATNYTGDPTDFNSEYGYRYFASVNGSPPQYSYTISTHLETENGATGIVGDTNASGLPCGIPPGPEYRITNGKPDTNTPCINEKE